MFADQIPSEEPTTLASLLPVVGWGIVAIVALVVAWRLYGKYGAPHFESVPDLVRGLLVKRAHATAAPAVEEGGAPAAPAAVPAATGVAPPAAPPPPIVQHPATTGAAPTIEGEPSTGAIKALIVAAALPSLFALPYIAWSIADLLVGLGAPALAALAAGVVADIALIGSVIVALVDPKSRKAATRWGWFFAAVAAGLVAIHAGLTVAVFVAVIPLLSKGLWGLVVSSVHRLRKARADHAAAARKRAEEKEKEKASKAAELSPELEHERLAEIAQFERDALYEERVAAAKLKKKLAVSQAEHLEALAEIKRLGEQKRAEDEESAKVYENQARLRRKFHALNGDVPGYLAGSVAAAAEDAEVVPEITAKAGFGAVSPPAFGFQRPLDVKALTPEGATVKFEDLPDHHQALVKYVHLAKEPSLREAGRKLGRDARTIGRWVDKLEGLGYELPFGREK